MKKIIMALVCATMSLTLMAQPNDKKDSNRPCTEQAGTQQGCPMMQGQGGLMMQGCPMKQGQGGPMMQGCPMMQGQGGPMMQGKSMGDMGILKQIGIDSTKIKQIKELKQQNRKSMQELNEKTRKAKQDLKAEYNKNLRQLLGDDTYIKYLEAKVAQSQMKGNKRPGMRNGKGMRRGMPRMSWRNGRMGQHGVQKGGMQQPGMKQGQPQHRHDGAQKSGDKKNVKKLNKLNKQNTQKKDSKK